MHKTHLRLKIACFPSPAEKLLVFFFYYYLTLAQRSYQKHAMIQNSHQVASERLGDHKQSLKRTRTQQITQVSANSVTFSSVSPKKSFD